MRKIMTLVAVLVFFSQGLVYGKGLWLPTIHWSIDGKWLGWQTTYYSAKKVPFEGGNSITITEEEFKRSFIEQKEEDKISSPDKRYVAYVDNNKDVWVVPQTSGEPLQITFGEKDFFGRPLSNRSFSWSPDSSRLAFFTVVNPQLSLLRINFSSLYFGGFVLNVVDMATGEGKLIPIDQDKSTPYIFIKRVEKEIASALVKLLKNEDPRVRFEATRNLIDINSREVIPELIKLLEDPVLFVRGAGAAFALGELRAQEAIPALLKMSLEGGETESDTAGSFEHQRGTAKRLRDEALYKIAGSDWYLKENVTPLGIEDYLKQLESNNWTISYQTVQALGRLKAKIAVPALIEKLDVKVPFSGYSYESSRHIRDYIAEALERIGDRRAVPALIGVLKEENCRANDSRIINSIVIALAKLGDKQAVPALIEKLSDNNLTREARICILQALGELGDPSAIPAIGKIIGGDDLKVCLTGIDILNSFNHKSKITFLIKALEDDRLVINVCVVNSLRKITGKSFGFVWSDPREKRDKAINKWIKWLKENY